MRQIEHDSEYRAVLRLYSNMRRRLRWQRAALFDEGIAEQDVETALAPLKIELELMGAELEEYRTRRTACVGKLKKRGFHRGRKSRP